jgi:hypothetical protein
MFYSKRTHCFKVAPLGGLYKQRNTKGRIVSWIYIYIYRERERENGLNESSFYQVGACL